jgi:hypothetical protein
VVGEFVVRPGATLGRADNEVLAGIAGDRFAEILTEELRLHGIRGKVRRGDPEPGALSLTGEITKLDEGNRVARTLVGFGLGAADFEATVRLTEVDTGRSLGVIALDKQSYPIGGIAAALHSVDLLMRSAAERATLEVAIAHSALKRGNVPAAKAKRQVGCGRGGPGCEKR